MKLLSTMSLSVNVFVAAMLVPLLCAIVRLLPLPNVNLPTEPDFFVKPTRGFEPLTSQPKNESSLAGYAFVPSSVSAPLPTELVPVHRVERPLVPVPLTPPEPHCHAPSD